MRRLADGSERYGFGDKALHYLLFTLDLGDVDGAAVALDFHQVSQVHRVIAVLALRRELLEGLVVVFPDRLLQQLYPACLPGVALASLAEGVESHILQRVDPFGSALLPIPESGLVRLQHIGSYVIDSHTFNLGDSSAHIIFEHF